MKRIIITTALILSLLMTMTPVAMADDATQTKEQAENTAIPVITATITEQPAILLAATEKITVSKAGKCKLKVKWEEVIGAEGYYVYRSKKEDSGFKKIKTIKSESKTSFTQKVIPNKNYYYKVKAIKTLETGEDGTAATRGRGENVIVGEASEVAKGKIKAKKVFKVKAYAYSGHSGTASGLPAKVGRIAVDPRVIPLGTWLYVEGYGLCQACDTGGMIKGKTIDVYMNSNAACNRWGVRYPKVYIL